MGGGAGLASPPAAVRGIESCQPGGENALSSQYVQRQEAAVFSGGCLAVPLAQEIVDDDLSNLEETSRAVMHHEGSGGGGGGGGSPRSDAAAAPASPRSLRPAALPAGARHEDSAERTL